MIVDLFQKTRASSRRIKNPKESAHAPVTVTCKTCGREWSAQQYGKNGYVCPECGTHGRIRCRERIRLTVDKDSFSELFSDTITNYHFKNKRVTKIKSALLRKRLFFYFSVSVFRYWP